MSIINRHFIGGSVDINTVWVLPWKGAIWLCQWVIKTSNVALFSTDRQFESPSLCGIWGLPLYNTRSHYTKPVSDAMANSDGRSSLQLAWLLWRLILIPTSWLGHTGKQENIPGSWSSSSNANRWAVTKKINATPVNHSRSISPLTCIQGWQILRLSIT